MGEEIRKEKVIDDTLHHGHGDVGVGVYHSGHDDVAGAVDLLVGGTIEFGSDGDYPLAVDDDVPSEDIAVGVLGDDPCVTEDCNHETVNGTSCLIVT